MVDITKMAARSGKVIRSDNTIVNEADGINPDGSRKVQLTGRNVKELQFHNAVAITDTANHNSPSSSPADVSSFSGRKSIVVNNTLNAPVTITIYTYTSNGVSGAFAVGQVNINSGNKLITPSDIPALAEPLQKIIIQAKCSTAPTSGSISTWLEGVEA